VVFPPDAAARLRAREAVPIEILHDAGDEASRGAMGRLQRLLGDVGKDITGARLRERGLPPDFAVPLKVAERPIPGGGGIGLLILGQMLPYILVLAAFTGAISPAFDQVAGEKERGTLETLLVAPASRRDVVLGKFGAVVAVCLISSVLSIVGFAIPFVSGLTVFAWLSQGGVRISPSALAAIGIVILPLSVLFAGLLLAVSTWARNQKEAQTYLSTLFPVVLVPALLSTTIGSEVSRAIALVPILNASIIIKQALSGTYDPVFIALAFAASAVYAALALAFATRLFQRESVLLKM
jgi:sodium transport system permease protein